MERKTAGDRLPFALPNLSRVLLEHQFLYRAAESLRDGVHRIVVDLLLLEIRFGRPVYG